MNTLQQNPWRTYAEEYHSRCDKYDEVLCGNNNGIHRTGDQFTLMNRHAKLVVEHLSRVAFFNGLASTLKGAELMVREAIRTFPNR